MVGLVWMLWLLLKRSLPSAWQLYATSINLIDLIWTHRSNYADCHNSRPHIDTTTTVSHIEFVSAAFFFSLFISIRDEYTKFYHSTHNSVSVWAGFSSVFDENVPLNWRLTKVLRAIPISRNDWINSRFSQFFSWRFFFYEIKIQLIRCTTLMIVYWSRPSRRLQTKLMAIHGRLFVFFHLTVLAELTFAGNCFCCSKHKFDLSPV